MAEWCVVASAAGLHLVADVGLIGFRRGEIHQELLGGRRVLGMSGNEAHDNGGGSPSVLSHVGA